MRKGIGYFFLLIYVCLPPHVFAAISSATATLSNNTITKNSSLQMSITVTNTDAQTVRYIKILRPSDAISITGVSSGWTVAWDSDYVILTGRTLASGASTEVTIDITSGSVDQSSLPWSVQVSDSAAGDTLFSATGDLSFTVSGDPPDTTSPIIANISLSTTNTSFTVNWDTDEAATGILSYGTTNAYGSTKESTSLTRSHSLTATGLVADTIYYFQIDSADGSGNTANSYNSFLVTGTTQPTATPTITPTPTSGPGATPTPTPIPDKTEPVVVLYPLAQESYKTSPNIRVRTSDEGGIENIYYAVNGGAYTRISGVGTTSSKPLEFSFTPKHATRSGTYRVQMKVMDYSGNVGLSDTRSYVLDGAGPQILFASSFQPVMKAMPTSRGTVLDPSGVATVEHTYDGGTTWRVIPSLVTDYGVEFSVDPLDAKKEGEYGVAIRATDGVGNITVSAIKRVIIDRFAPRSAGVVVASGAIPLIPDSISHIRGLTHYPYTIYVSSSGGVVTATIIVTDRLGREISRVPMTRSVKADMWQANFTPVDPSEYGISIEMDDRVNPKAVEQLFQLDIQNSSCVSGESLKLASVSVYAMDTLQRKFSLWNASAFDQNNPIKTDGTCYSYLLPRGSYRLQARAHGFTATDTNTFEVPHASFVSVPFTLKKAQCIQLWNYTFCNPFHDQVHAQPIRTDVFGNADEHIVGQRLSGVFTERISELMVGKEIELIVMNSWMPDSHVILENLERRVKESQSAIVVVLPHESDAYAKAWKQEMGTTIQVIGDPDGELAQEVGYHLGPLAVGVSDQLTIRSKHIVKNR